MQTTTETITVTLTADRFATIQRVLGAAFWNAQPFSEQQYEIGVASSALDNEIASYLTEQEAAGNK